MPQNMLLRAAQSQSLGMKVGKRSLSDVTTRTKISAYIESLSSSTGRWQAA